MISFTDMKQFIRWMFFSNLLPDGKELEEVAWVAVMATISVLVESVALAITVSIGDQVTDTIFTIGIIWLLWMMIFALVGFQFVGATVIPAGLSLVAYGFNAAPAAWSLPETLFGLWMTLRCFSDGFSVGMKDKR